MVAHLPDLPTARTAGDGPPCRGGGRARRWPAIAWWPQYDLLAVEPGERLVVVDWKAVLKRPSRANLARRLQTRVYRYLAVEGGAAFNGGQPPEPEQVEMIYWFAEFGGAVERFPYDADQHAGRRRLSCRPHRRDRSATRNRSGR